MQTNTKFFAVLFIFFASALSFSKLKAQVFLLTNNTPCNVIIGYEIGDNSTGNCNVCGAGSIVVPPGGFPVALPNCGTGTRRRICIWVVSIGGASAIACHNDCSTSLWCCMQQCFSGTRPAASACLPLTPYNIAVVPGTSWTIN